MGKFGGKWWLTKRLMTRVTLTRHHSSLCLDNLVQDNGGEVQAHGDLHWTTILNSRQNRTRIASTKRRLPKGRKSHALKKGRWHIWPAQSLGRKHFHLRNRLSLHWVSIESELSHARKANRLPARTSGRCWMGAKDDLDFHSWGKIRRIVLYHSGFIQECSKMTMPR